MAERVHQACLLCGKEGRKFLEWETEVKQTGRAILGLNSPGQWRMGRLLLRNSFPRQHLLLFCILLRAGRMILSGVVSLLHGSCQEQDSLLVIHRDT